MDERAKEIAKAVDTGEYFSEAMNWYNRVFVYPLRDSVIMRLIGYVAIGILAFMLINIYRMFPLTEKVEVLAHLSDTINFFPRIIRADDSKTTRQFVTEELAARYVNGRESYDSRRFKNDYVFILKSSSKKVFDKYYKYISSKDLGSPLSLSIDNKITKVKILSKESVSDANKVTVTFEKTIFDIFGAFQSSSKWKADIEFYLSNYDFSESTNAKLDFIVTKYTVSEMKKS
ncbi:MAG: hypothetical protein HRU36_02145 [Rickettsiales bacterium]|nr:hypothetical protein [Rickettsiales bacterium]